ncbi:UDP-2,4-diacetamido-2,4,6-trideoxy-beta-L-altropyranose hydrolase [Mesorhizobium sp. 1M-11]|uniref:UDP-2,4-diacetamido-2,4, 6-trideoxy-beta-L-altropyranose hydrolase n=1 Tax=Mesorhizobium sp. 1M-11 TaxID=1529006 RepID=UPI0006C7512C|nr:UDP-2,4-diacetamido-2,4,6-trideoxy-beta-L-altropyranose hydrolase [Mesorhizobium sp. 1M-11]
MQAVIRCDAGSVIGGGHLVRCGALGAALKREGVDVAFAVSDETVTTLPRLFVDFPDVLKGMTTAEGDVDRMISRWPSGVELAVVDHYSLGEDFEKALAGWARKVLVIDDAPLRRHICTHLVDTTFRRRSEEYREQVDIGTMLLCGSDFAMLRQAFQTERHGALERAPSAVRRILISMGLSDNVNATQAVLKGIFDAGGEFEVDCVLGSAAPHLHAVRTALSAGGRRWRLHTDADAEMMAALTGKADIVVGAPGSASYERCCLGRPTLLLVVADNQLHNAAALQDAGAAIVIGKFSHDTSGRVANSIRGMVEDPSKLHDMHLAAAAICDGGGANRVVRAVLDS